MGNEKRIPGELVHSVTCEEILISTGIQLLGWANDLAFTDAAYGENWCIEAANRMASCSEVLNLLYKKLPQRALGLVIDLPNGVVGEIRINPDHVPGSALEGFDDLAKAAKGGGDDLSIDEFPF